ncbi:hypothetical protein V2A60_010295 [Cordyceps javanica]|uniref:C6 zinc finger domain-containing protein n=1 Tax=Cordyceps javanica TaxID=43265 RepID=A0A545VUG6_9HYPO|nr:C6 zinc finger domain-containing protein [Cordyceps javanica]TQW05371.1 C6 zinc finger domain-containing protein [Cordyceps javanica]
MACHYEVNPPENSQSINAVPAHAFSALIQAQLIAAPGHASEDEAEARRRRTEQRQYMQAIFSSCGPWIHELFGSTSVPVWLVPEGWEAFEAIEFMNNVVDPDTKQTDVAESTHQAKARTEAYNPSNDIIIASALCTRIARIADIENANQLPTPSCVHLWARLQQLLASSIKTLSRQITDLDNVVQNKVLQRICDMTGIEEYLHLTGGRAHIRGFLAILKHFGRPIDLARTQIGLGNAIHVITTTAVVSNTFAQYHDNFMEINAFSNQELVDIYCLTLESSFPCPSFLWRQILEIGKLRGMVASGLDATVAIEKAKTILHCIESFVPETWQESYTIPEGRAASLLASVYKSATIIYCCGCVSDGADGGRAFTAWGDPIQASWRIPLLRSLSEAVEFDANLSDPTLWPLVVAGYAAKKGSYAERSLVDRLLGDMGRDWGRGPPELRARLSRFWVEGVSWDDLWRVPYTFMT